jgi:hypothetical protein
MKLTLIAPGAKRLKLKYDAPLSNFALKCNLCRCILALAERRDAIKTHVTDMAKTSYENHRVFVPEKFNKVVAPKLRAQWDNTGLSQVSRSTLTDSWTDAHKGLSVRVSVGRCRLPL